MNHTAVTLAILIAASVTQPGIAGCNVMPKPESGTAKILVQEGRKEVPYLIEVENCQPLRVLEGEVLVAWRSRKDTSEVPPFIPCTPAADCIVPKDALAAVKQDKIRVPAFKRMDEANSRLSGIPAGRILDAENAARFDFAKAGISQWQLAVIDVRSKRPIVMQSGNQPSFSLPVSALSAGGKYQWKLREPGGERNGGFDILSEKEAATVRNALDAARKEAGVEDWKQQFARMLIYYDFNLYHEASLIQDSFASAAAR